MQLAPYQMSSNRKRIREPEIGIAKPKLLSSVNVVMRSQPVAEEVIQPDILKSVVDFGHSKPVLQEVHKIPDVTDRNKRLFGNLIGHLGRAKKNFDSDTKVEVQNRMKEEAARKNSEESIRINLLRKKVAEVEREKERNLRSQAILR